MNEKQYISSLTETYISDLDENNKYYYWKKKECVSKYAKFVEGSNRKRATKLLELGCSMGASTKEWVDLVDEVTCVEGAAELIKQSKKVNGLENVIFINCLFEEMEFDNQFDYVVADHVFEHVDNIDEILLKCHKALNQSGLLFAAVPNAHAFSRQMAVEMELLDNIYELTENDTKYGHRRVFDRETFEDVIKKNNFKIIESGGSFFKPFADFQLKKMIETEIIGDNELSGLVKMGRVYPHLCEGLYVIAKK